MIFTSLSGVKYIYKNHKADYSFISQVRKSRVTRVRKSWGHEMATHISSRKEDIHISYKKPILLKMGAVYTLKGNATVKHV